MDCSLHVLPFSLVDSIDQGCQMKSISSVSVTRSFFLQGYDVLLKVGFGVFCVECRVRHVLADGPLRSVHGGAQRGAPDGVQTLAATVVLLVGRFEVVFG